MPQTIEFVPPSASGGPTIAKLAHSIEFDGEQVDRVTIPALKGKHLLSLPFRMREVPPIGQLVQWANFVVTPNGVMEELHPSDAWEIAHELYGQLGKALTTGETPSE